MLDLLQNLFGFQNPNMLPNNMQVLSFGNDAQLAQDMVSQTAPASAKPYLDNMQVQPKNGSYDHLLPMVNNPNAIQNQPGFSQYHQQLMQKLGLPGQSPMPNSAPTAPGTAPSTATANQNLVQNPMLAQLPFMKPKQQDGQSQSPQMPQMPSMLPNRFYLNQPKAAPQMPQPALSPSDPLRRMMIGRGLTSPRGLLSE